MSAEPKRRNRGQFVKGDPRIAPLAAKAGGQPSRYTDEVEDELAAMERVWRTDRRDDRSHQHRNLRAMKDANPAGFWDRMQRLKAGQAPAPDVAAPAWDGKGPCPVCRREAEREDQGTARLMELFPAEFELVKQFRHHRTEFLAWLGQQQGVAG